MTEASNNQKIFKLILSAVASGDLTDQDYRSALVSLRDGPLVKVLDQIFEALSMSVPEGDSGERLSKLESSGRPKTSNSRPLKKERKASAIGIIRDPKTLFDDIKRRKITRERLENIIASIDGEFLDHERRAETMRNLVALFHEKSTSRQWELLTSIVNGDFEIDPYFENTK